MGRKTVKYILRGIGVIAALILLLIVLLYLPPVQNFIKNKAVRTLSSSLGMNLSIDRLRIKFPLRVVLENAAATGSEGDTIVYFEKLEAEAAILPLLRRQLRASSLSLENAVLDYRDSVSGLSLRGAVGTLGIYPVRWNLRNNRIEADNLNLGAATLDLYTGISVEATDTTTTASAPWYFEVGNIRLDDVAFRMNDSTGMAQIDAMLAGGLLADSKVDIGQATVTASSVTLTDGKVFIYTDSFDSKIAEEIDSPSIVSDTTGYWTVAVTEVVLDNISGKYGTRFDSQVAGFDAENIEVTGLSAEVDSVFNRGPEVAGTVRSLTLTERSGFEIREMHGRFRMDSTAIYVGDVFIRTVGSTINVDAGADTGLFAMEPDADVDIEINAEVSPADLYRFYNPSPEIRSVLGGRNVSLDADIGGTVASLDIRSLTASIPGYLSLRASGTLSRITDPANLGLDATFATDVHNAGILKGFITDTTLAARIGFPRDLSVGGHLTIAGNVYQPDIVITADSGSMDVKGRLDVRAESYDADILARVFPLNAFLPNDSLGIATFSLTAAGQGFDPLSDGASSDIDLQIERFDYRGYPYSDIMLTALLAGGRAEVAVEAEDPAVDLGLNVSANIESGVYEGELTGRVDRIDLYRLYLSQTPFAASGTIDGSFYIQPADSLYRAEIVLDTTRVAYGEATHYIGRSVIMASASVDSVSAYVATGDLTLDFDAPVSVGRFGRDLGRASESIGRQIDSARLDMAAIQETLPPFVLSLTAGRDNVASDILLERGLTFNHLEVSAATDDSAPLHAEVLVTGFQTGSLTLDTLNVGMKRKEQDLGYYIRLANRPGNIDPLALMYIYGNVGGDRAVANFYQRDRSDSVGFRFGLNAQLIDSAVTVVMTPENPTFGYERWRVNPDNYLTYYFNRSIAADLRLDGDGQHLYVRSADMDSMTGTAINLDMAGINIGTTLRLIPSAPDIDGILSSDIDLGFGGSRTALSGTVGIDSLNFGGEAVGNIGITADYMSDTTGRSSVDATLAVDGREALKLSGEIVARELDITADITSMPLYLVNAFTPPETVNASGTLDGSLAVAGTTQNPVIDGQLTFTDARVEVEPIGTAFGLSPAPIYFRQSEVRFDSWAVTSPGGSNLVIDGLVDVSDFSNIETDLDINATAFDVVSSTYRDGSMVYGRALADIDLSVRGTLDALSARGSVSLLNGTDVTYTMRDQPLSVEDQQQDIVTFVSFADSVALVLPDSLFDVRASGMDVLVNIDIADGVKATINLSDEGNNRVEVTGEGNLTYTMNTQGDARFTGRFELSGGTVVYNPPVIQQANFTIDDGSYIEWAGEMTNPSFNITARESLGTTVTMEDGSSSNVNFNIIVIIANTLDDLSITFDLAAPDNLVIQNQLASLAPEQRSQQAMALLVYNTYTGPGTTARVDNTNPLNNFIENELNQWARNNLRNVDLSFGINQSQDAATGNQHTDYSYSVSKSLFDDRVTVRIGGSINPETSATDNLENNFVDDIALEYRLTRRDNMFLKFYRYNTQESILEGEVVETGVGFVVRKKLNKISDLFRFNRSPERKEARSRRREIKQQIRRDEVRRGIDPAKEQRQEEPQLSEADKTEEEPM